MAKNIIEIILKTSGSGKAQGDVNKFRKSISNLAGQVGLGIGLSLAVAEIKEFIGVSGSGNILTDRAPLYIVIEDE